MQKTQKTVKKVFRAKGHTWPVQEEGGLGGVNGNRDRSDVGYSIFQGCFICVWELNVLGASGGSCGSIVLTCPILVGTRGSWEEEHEESTSQDFQVRVFYQLSLTLCYPILHLSLTTIFLYTGLQKRWLEGPEETILSISLPHTKSSQTVSTEFSAFFLENSGDNTSTTSLEKLLLLPHSSHLKAHV